MRGFIVGFLPVLAISIVLVAGYAAGTSFPVNENLRPGIILAMILLSFLFVFPVLLGLLSMPFHGAIRKGRFKRDLSDDAYYGRACYGRLWTSLFYSGPIYQVFLGIRPYRNFVLRLFGMKGPLEFTVFPDTWIRDLPVLSVSDGAYMANKSTIGTNICLKDNFTLVDGIKFGQNAMVGHMAVIGPGCKINSGSELGVSSTLGIRVSIAENSSIGALVAVNHGSSLGQRINVGTRAYIGVRVNISDDVTIPPNTVIPDGNSVVSNADLVRVLLKSKSEIMALVQEVQGVISKQGTHD